MTTQQLTTGFTLANKYELLDRLSAQTGQGQVWRARQTADGVEVAVKVMIPDNPAEALRTMAKETKALRQIPASKHVAAFIDSGVASGYYYVVSQLIRGKNLHELMQESNGRLGDRDLRRAARGSLKALDSCRRAGVVHNDVKPSNLVMDTSTGVVVLVDFGVSVSLLATTETSAGRTPIFMSPEYDRPKPPPESDIFSWASTMVNLATGEYAFANGVPSMSIHVKMAEIFSQHSEEPNLSGVPSWLRPLCEAAFRWDPSDRPAAADLLRMLRVAPSGEPDHARTELDLPFFKRGPLRELMSRPAAAIPATVAGLGLFRLVPGPTLWRLLSSVAAFAAVGGLILRPPDASTPVRRATGRYVARWRRMPGFAMPAAEFAVCCTLGALILSSTVVSARPSSAGADRAVLFLMLGIAMVLPAAIGPGRVQKYSNDSTMARIVVPLICLALPVILLQLRDLGVTHLDFLHRLVPWWALFAAAVLVAGWGGVGEAAARSGAFYVASLVFCALVGVVSIAWTATFHPRGGFGDVVWKLYTTEVRAAFVSAAICSILPLSLLKLGGHWARFAINVAILGATCSAVLIGWWVGWIPQVRPWIDFHLPSGFLPWE